VAITVVCAGSVAWSMSGAPIYLDDCIPPYYHGGASTDAPHRNGVGQCGRGCDGAMSTKTVRRTRRRHVKDLWSRQLRSV
jgi:hypothetical protein